MYPEASPFECVGPTLTDPGCSAPQPAALHPFRLWPKHQGSVCSRYLASTQQWVV